MNHFAGEQDKAELKAPFYRQTDNAEILQFREKLSCLSEEEIYHKLSELQGEVKFDFALECFDEVERRRQSDSQPSNS